MCFVVATSICLQKCVLNRGQSTKKENAFDNLSYCPSVRISGHDWLLSNCDKDMLAIKCKIINTCLPWMDK